jgi:hypothetical protein
MRVALLSVAFGFAASTVIPGATPAAVHTDRTEINNEITTERGATA